LFSTKSQFKASIIEIFNRTIKTSPVEGSKKENESIVYKNLYREFEMVREYHMVGDKVRISKWKGTFEKGYLPK
jgi:hypothetical protein